MAEVLLSAQKVTKRFGGLAAVNGVSVGLWRCQHHPGFCLYGCVLYPFVASSE